MGDDSSTSQILSVTGNLPTPPPSNAVPTPGTFGSIVAGGSPNADITHATGNIVSLTNPVMAGTMGHHRIDQPMANASFKEFFQRNVLVQTINNFTSTGVVREFKPWEDWVLNTQVNEKLRNFNYIRGSMIVSGKLIAPSLSMGMATITAVPCYEERFAFQTCPQTHSLIPLHVVVDLSTSSDFEMTLPWIVSSNWGSLQDALFMHYWHLTVRVNTGLTTAIPDGCASATMQLFCRAGPDLGLSGAQYQAGPGYPLLYETYQAKVEYVDEHAGTTLATSTGSSISNSSFNRSKPTGPGSAPSSGPGPGFRDRVNGYFKDTFGYKASELAGGVATVAGVGAAVTVEVPPVAGVLATVAGVAGTAAKILDYFGFTRKAIVVRPEDCLLKTSQNLIACDGEDSSRKAALFGSNALSILPAINGTFTQVDETALAFTGGRFTHVGVLKFTVGDTSFQDQIIPVTPCLGVWSESDTKFTPTASGYVAGKFSFWRGDVKFIFYPVVSAVHRGSLQFIWQPVPSAADITRDLTNVSLNSIVDVAAAQPIEITVGYNNDNPACRTEFYALDTNIGLADYSALNGYLRVRAIVPFAGSICGQIIDVHVYAASSDNMEFFGPTETVILENVPVKWANQLHVEEVYQSGTVGADGQELITVSLVPPTGRYPVVENLAGEDVRSIRALIQKPSSQFVLDVYRTIPTEGAFVFTHDPLGLDDAMTLHDSCNWFSYFARQYLAFAGSIRYKWIVDTQAADPDLSGLEMTVGMCNSNAAGGGLPLAEFNPTVTATSVTSECQLPYYNAELWVPAYKRGDLTPTDYAMVDIHGDGLETITRVALYRSAGPDCRLTTFRGQLAWKIEENERPRWNVFMPWTLGGLGAGGRAAARSAEVEPTFNGFTLDQYRARTGRTEFPDVSKMKRRVKALFEPSG